MSILHLLLLLLSLLCTTLAVSITQHNGIKQIYPTKQNGRQWTFTQPKDPYFDPRQTIVKQSDGSYQNTEPQTRLEIHTKANDVMWRDVELTGYFKVNKKTGDKMPQLVLYARGGRHTTKGGGCDGTSIKGYYNFPGDLFFKKEVWHTGGYTARLSNKHYGQIINKWVGLKMVMYNTAPQNVKMELYVDRNATNNWVKEIEFEDHPGQVKGKEHKAECKNPITKRERAQDATIYYGGPIAAFRADDIIFQFKDLNVREICAGTCDQVQQKGCEGFPDSCHK
ncbi:hypothetical protein AKO1_006341 [Acrasis kona]|uniref:Alginate lyase 2 domain-containing protein n=1 Tax=Acrasis kona TaxID=1008807 RepID=A0AAW2YKC7_9EUKA